MKLPKMICLTAVLLSLAASGCRKKVATAPPAPAPVAQEELAAEPQPEPAAPEPAPVVTAEEPAPAPTPPQPSFLQEVERLLADAYFDYDRHDLRPDAREVLLRNGDNLKQLFAQFPDARIKIEGHADERGSAEYNLGLADRRAAMAKEFLGTFGISPERIVTISYGKERPQCSEANEGCWQRNRRAHFTPE